MKLEKKEKKFKDWNFTGNLPEEEEVKFPGTERERRVLKSHPDRHPA